MSNANTSGRRGSLPKRLVYVTQSTFRSSELRLTIMAPLTGYACGLALEGVLVFAQG